MADNEARGIAQIYRGEAGAAAAFGFFVMISSAGAGVFAWLAGGGGTASA